MSSQSFGSNPVRLSVDIDRLARSIAEHTSSPVWKKRSLSF
jgi:hypothetical protein